MPEPNFTKFFDLYQFSLSNPQLLFQKAGHFLAFLLLAFLLFACFNHILKTTLYGLAFGLALEMIQPFFDRGGRMLDVLINWSGVFLFVLAYLLISRSILILEYLKETRLSEKT
ncbi:VanZ family protein [Halalkalibacter alkalisediminis]|uniref:VanZ family protein n=1 Tax=Halalkalibacter alkalisediminis TaxID=935616 RepID=UPI003B5902B5